MEKRKVSELKKGDMVDTNIIHYIDIYGIAKNRECSLLVTPGK